MDRQMDRWMDGWLKKVCPSKHAGGWMGGRQECVFSLSGRVKERDTPFQCHNPAAPLPVYTEPLPHGLWQTNMHKTASNPRAPGSGVRSLREEQSDGWYTGQLKQESKGFGPCVTSS